MQGAQRSLQCTRAKSQAVEPHPVVMSDLFGRVTVSQDSWHNYISLSSFQSTDIHGKETSDAWEVQHNPRFDAPWKALFGAIPAIPTFDQEDQDDSSVSPFLISSAFVPASRIEQCLASIAQTNLPQMMSQPALKMSSWCDHQRELQASIRMVKA